MKKGKKAHIAVDTRDGFIVGGHITPARVAHISAFDKLLGRSMPCPDSLVVADKGHRSMRNRATLEERTYIHGIMDKAAQETPHSHPAPYKQTHQQCALSGGTGMGTLKRGYGFSRMRYTGLQKGNMEFILTVITFNLKKAVLMMGT